MSVHCSRWSHNDSERPTEYDEFLTTGKRKNKKYRSIPETSNFVRRYYESGFLWKAQNGSYVWVRRLP